MKKQRRMTHQQELFSPSQVSPIAQQRRLVTPKKRKGPITLRLTQNCPEAQYPDDQQPDAQYEIDRGQFNALLVYRKLTGMPLRLIVRRALAEFLERHRVGRTTDRIQ